MFPTKNVDQTNSRSCKNIAGQCVWFRTQLSIVHAMTWTKLNRFTARTIYSIAVIVVSLLVCVALLFVCVCARVSNIGRFPSCNKIRQWYRWLARELMAHIGCRLLLLTALPLSDGASDMDDELWHWFGYTRYWFLWSTSRFYRLSWFFFCFFFRITSIASLPTVSIHHVMPFYYYVLLRVSRLTIT